MFSKVLIANRGEIASRVVRACRKLGVASIAVFSDADANLPYVGEATESCYLGPSPAADSYLNMQRLLELAKEHGAEAIHPGYGFLAENHAFALLCEQSGVKFIGPTSDAIDKLGDKRHAKNVAEKAGVAVTPWFECSEDFSGAADQAEELGFPVMIKPVAGGGGKGMHRADSATELTELLNKAAREALASFGDAALLVEKFLPSPRHIEVQILADEHGHVIHLHERECSLQRRHQKLIEESPSPALDPGQREAICQDAVAIATGANYVNAGTCEFLYDEASKSWYFCEVNTRLQVEHPVTEMVTGVDLVEWQLRIAAGEKLSLKQAEIPQLGHAIEFRINSEDPFEDFRPSLGHLEAFEPPQGDGIRVDAGYAAGDSVTQYYDSLLAKLIVHGEDRTAALALGARALREFMVVGVATTVPFHLALLEDEGFREGRFHIHYVEGRLQELLRRDRNADAAVLAALMEYRQLLRMREAQRSSGDSHFSAWSSSSLPRVR